MTQTFKMGAGITESEKERHLNGFSSTPVKSESRVRSPTEHKVAFCFFDCTLILVSLFAFILDTVTGDSICRFSPLSVSHCNCGHCHGTGHTVADTVTV